jgi:hypothetical protein
MKDPLYVRISATLKKIRYICIGVTFCSTYLFFETIALWSLIITCIVFFVSFIYYELVFVPNVAKSGKCLGQSFGCSGCSGRPLDDELL